MKVSLQLSALRLVARSDFGSKNGEVSLSFNFFEFFFFLFSPRPGHSTLQRNVFTSFLSWDFFFF